MVWDRGTWTPEAPDVDAALAKGDLKFTLHGEKLKGSWVLVRTKAWGDAKKPAWLLIKHRDDFASDEDVAETRPRSVVSNRLLTQIAIDEGGDVEKASTGDPVGEVEKLLKDPKLLERKKKGKPSVWHSKPRGEKGEKTEENTKKEKEREEEKISSKGKRGGATGAARRGAIAQPAPGAARRGASVLPAPARRRGCGPQPPHAPSKKSLVSPSSSPSPLFTF